MVRSLMTYIDLPDSFWEYALEIVHDILNLVPSKAVSTTPKELWSRHTPSLLKRDPSKLEAMTDVCLFVGYPKGTKGYLFYDPQDQRVIVSTNTCFLEEDYLMDNKFKVKFVLDELRGEGVVSSVP